MDQAYKTAWERERRKDPAYLAKIREANKNRRIYKREWLAAKRKADPVFAQQEKEKTNAWRKANPKRIGIRSRRRKLIDRHEEQMPGHCRSCGIKLKDKTEKLCDTSYCQRG